MGDFGLCEFPDLAAISKHDDPVSTLLDLS
jgi:hypothetical protein